jgi:hypothetical protein
VISQSFPDLRIAAGRRLPPLLFATSRVALRRSIGREEADHALKALSDQSFLVYDGLPDEMPHAADAIALVQKQLSGHPEIQGVVLIGGHERRNEKRSTRATLRNRRELKSSARSGWGTNRRRRPMQQRHRTATLFHRHPRRGPPATRVPPVTQGRAHG